MNTPLGSGRGYNGLKPKQPLLMADGTRAKKLKAMRPPTRYILISSVKNEMPHLSETLEAIAAQHPLPLRLYVIDDGSTDNSLETLLKFAETHPWVSVNARSPDRERDWASKDRNLNSLFTQAQTELGNQFDFVAIQDLDQTPVGTDYFAKLLWICSRDGSVAISGGVIYERVGTGWVPRASNAHDSTPGSVLLRRDFFERIGGCMPLEFGGSDWLLQIDAYRLKLRVCVEPSCVLHHHRPTNATTLQGAFKSGQMDASFGSDPLFEFVKCGRRALHNPMVGTLRLLGFASYALTRKPVIGQERIDALRNFQTMKLWKNKRP
jgi:glycosyl transferase family 2